MKVEEILESKGYGIHAVGPECTIQEALAKMAAHNVGAICVTDKGKMTGIWTVRDLSKNVLQDGFDVRTSLVRDYMASPVKSIPHNKDVHELMDRFLKLEVRHLLVSRRGQFVGMLSAGDAMRALLQVRKQELKELNEIASWEYYEDWHWDKPKRRKYGAALQAPAA